MTEGTSKKKEYRKTQDADTADKTLPAKKPKTDQNRAGTNAGQAFEHEPFADPLNNVVTRIGGLGGLHDDIGEKSGFATDGYIDKQGTPFGEAAKFNFLPPGMDISNQENAEIHDMPMKKVTSESYPGDGWEPMPRDIPE